MFVIYTLIITAILFLPGYGFARALGLSRVPSLAAGPAISVGIIAVGAVLLDLIGLPFTPWTTLAFFALVCVACWALRIPLRRIGYERMETPTPHLGTLLGAAVGWFLGVAIVARAAHRFMFPLPSATAVWDSYYHFSAVQWIAQHHMGSSLKIQGDMAGIVTFYPSGFHDTTALALMIAPNTNATIALLASVLAFAVVWVTGCLALVRVIFGRRPITLAFAGPLALAFPAFPLQLPTVWPLYANYCGLTMVPGVLACVVVVCGLAKDMPKLSLATAALPGLIAMAGVGFGHPNSAVGMVLLACVIVGIWLVKALREAKTTGSSTRLTWILASTVFAVAFVLWVIVRPRASDVKHLLWMPRSKDSLQHLVMVSGVRNGPYAATAAILTVLGIWVSIVRKEFRWLLAVYGVGLAILLLTTFVPNGWLHDTFTGTWYSDPYRVAAQLVVVSYLIAVYGIDALITPPDFRRKLIAGFMSLALGYFVLTDAATNDVLQQGWLLHHGGPVNVEKSRILQRLDDKIPEGAKIAAVPFNGSGMAYAWTGHPVMIPATYFGKDPLILDVMENLKYASSIPSVCDSVRTLDLHYVLDFGSPLMAVEAQEMAGMFGFDSTSGFTELDREGDYGLYRIDVCWN
ncbi:MAG: DUF6541 family protein [Propionibacteriaceae bacterium]